MITGLYHAPESEMRRQGGSFSIGACNPINLMQRLDFERNHTFFVCKTDLDIRVTFEEGMESSFKCAKCANQLESSENAGMITVLEARVQKLEAELSR